ncbi:MAG: histidinol-phosphatase HisJ family protein [Alphaproteobacteria bacterium]|nr:histidinol-phosphatase HisJ family protein [Alphaproteobacteria bacterium]
MMQRFTLHTHTVGFDGEDTARDMVSRACNLGFKTIGFSNHLILHPEINQAKFYHYAKIGGYDSIYSATYDEAISKFAPHYDELSAINHSCTGILRGLEVDFFCHPRWEREYLRAVDTLKPDYVIGACHIVEHNGRLYNIHDIRNANADVRDKLLTLYWQKVAYAAASGLFTWLAHIDLPKKVGLGREQKWHDHEARTIESISDNKIPVEINTRFFKSYCYEPYPSPRIMQMMGAKNIPVLLSDDAHRVSQIGGNFDIAQRMAHENGVNNFLTLQKILDFSNKTK